LCYLDPRTNLKAFGFLAKIESDKDWVCQLLIEHVNDNSSVTQEEMEYALCWRQGPVVLFPLKERKKNPETPSNWDLLSSLSPLITLLFLQLRRQSQSQHHNPRLPPLPLPLLTLLHLPPFNSLPSSLLPLPLLS
jgi:hypothetical protein